MLTIAARPSLIPGRLYKIKGFIKPLDRSYRYKLLAMGLVPSSRFQVIRVAPLGDPIEININGFHLSLRRKELAMIHCEIYDL